MPLAGECVCCCEISAIVRKKDVSHGIAPVRCITEHRGFQNVYLDVWVLQAAYYINCQHYGSHTRHHSIQK